MQCLGQGYLYFSNFQHKLIGPWVLPWCLEHSNSGLLEAEVSKATLWNQSGVAQWGQMIQHIPSPQVSIQKCKDLLRKQNTLIYPKVENKLKSVKSPHHKRQLVLKTKNVTWN